LLGAAVLLPVRIVVSKGSGWLSVSARTLFLVIGMLASFCGLGGICFDDPRLVQWLDVVDLIFILHAGALDTGWQRIRPVLVPGLVLPRDTCGSLKARDWGKSYPTKMMALLSEPAVHAIMRLARSTPPLLSFAVCAGVSYLLGSFFGPEVVKINDLGVWNRLFMLVDKACAVFRQCDCFRCQTLHSPPPWL
jgi:hypothetical protein